MGTTVTGIQTAITLYTLVMASLMITGGKLGQVLGQKRAFAIGCAIYGCGSFTTAASPSLGVLMFGWSFLEGVGAALILPAIVALVASNFERAERPRAYGLVASAGAIAVAAGPLIGGLFTTYLSWRGEEEDRQHDQDLAGEHPALGHAAARRRGHPAAPARRVVRPGFLVLLAGILVMVAALDAGAGPEIVTWPMLLAGLGVGALASQLGSVTVSSVTDERSGEVGGLQNTLTNLGASIGTALVGAVLISALTTSLLTGVQGNAAIPQSVKQEAQVKLGGGIPFVSDADLKAALKKADAPKTQADAIVEQNATARIDGLRSALAVLAMIALIAAVLTFRLPTVQPGAAATAGAPP